MTKLEETLLAHPEMSAIDVTRIEVRKVAEPTLRGALEAVVDLVGELDRRIWMHLRDE